jgi:hypothetical protein
MESEEKAVAMQRLGTPCCLCVPQRLKYGMMESEAKAVAMQRLGKHDPLSMNTHATVGTPVFYAVRVVSNT